MKSGRTVHSIFEDVAATWQSSTEPITLPEIPDENEDMEIVYED